MKNKTTQERGKFKEEIHAALYNNQEIRQLIVGNGKELSAAETREEFKRHVKSHLFIDDTMEETGVFIFYDVRMPKLRENTKKCDVLLYVICHEDMLDQYRNEKYPGNMADALSQMVEDCLINDDKTANSFGIGRLTLDSVDIYLSKRFYGCIMLFSVPNFR